MALLTNFIFTCRACIERLQAKCLHGFKFKFMSIFSKIGNALLGSVGSIATGLIGGISNTISSNSTNKANAKAVADTNATNLQIAQENNAANLQSTRETNEANAALADKQNEWNLEQWNRENEYNSPANQVALLEQAGLNGLNYDTGSANASSIQSANLANQVASPANANATMQAYQAQPTDYNWISQLGSMVANNNATNANTAKTKADTKLSMLQYEFNSVMNGKLIDSQDEANRLASMMNDVYGDTIWKNRSSAARASKAENSAREYTAKYIMKYNKEKVKSVADFVASELETVKAQATQASEQAWSMVQDNAYKPVMLEEGAKQAEQTTTNLQLQGQNLGKQGELLGKQIQGEDMKNHLLGNEVDISDATKDLKKDELNEQARRTIIRNICGNSTAAANWLSDRENFDHLMSFCKKVSKNGGDYHSPIISYSERSAYTTFQNYLSNMTPVGVVGDMTGINSIIQALGAFK